MYLFVRITLYILVTSLRLNICIANIFSDSVICLLTLLMSFDEWTFFILMQSHVSVFSLSPGLSCNKEQLISFPSFPPNPPLWKTGKSLLQILSYICDCLFC